MTRRRFRPKDYLARLLDHNGKCAHCAVKIGPATGLEWDHEIPLAQGGDDEMANLQPLCRNCHAAKTKVDAGNTAKAKRREIANLGLRTTTRSFPPAARKNRASAPLMKQLPPRRAI